jgi:hypothetical protein
MSRWRFPAKPLPHLTTQRGRITGGVRDAAIPIGAAKTPPKMAEGASLFRPTRANFEMKLLN